MASGSSGRAPNSGNKAFDFASDDILCSYEDYGARDGTAATHSDPSIAANPGKEFHKSRMARASVFPAASYSPPEESSFNQDVVSAVESSMKKYSDNIMRFLEGLSSRLSQLELYCYNLDKSIGEMRSDLVRDHEGSESRLKSLEKHMQEVHRSVQILRDKQELADTQKELAKLQLAQKESSSNDTSAKNKDGISTPASEAKTSEHSSDSHDQQLAIVPHQAAPQPMPIEHQQPTMPPPSSMPQQSLPPGHAYYLQHPPQTTPMTTPSQPPQPQYLPAQSQIQDPSRMSLPPHPSQPQVNQTPHVQQVPSYPPPQWAPHQQLPQPGQPPQQAVMQQPQIRGSSQVVYSNYLPGQSNQSPGEMAPNSMPMQVPFVGASQTLPPGSEPPPPYGFVPATRPAQPQHVKTGYGSTQQPGDGYVHGGPHPALPPGNAYMMYDGEGGRVHQPPPQQPHYQQNAYPPTNIPMQNPQRVRSHPYNELIEKLVNMGYRGDHVVGTIQRLEESGQAIDFNSVLDRLNGGGGPQRGWSG